MAYNYPHNSSAFAQSDPDLDWSNEFIYDSPQPTPQPGAIFTDATSKPAPDPGEQQSQQHQQQHQQHQQHQQQQSLPHTLINRPATQADEGGLNKHTAPLASSPSSTSDDRSSRDSSENHIQPASSSSSPPFATFGMATNPDSPSAQYKSETMFMEMDDSQYAFDDSTFPMGEQGMNELSLNQLDHVSGNQPLDFSSASDTSTIPTSLFQDVNLISNTTGNGATNKGSSIHPSPRMTVQPSKMFQVGSREDSPSSVALGTSLEDSPAPLYHNSPLSGNDGFTKTPQANYSNVGLTLERPTAQYQTLPATSASKSVSPQARAKSATIPKWPCRLTVDQTPDKSRVETQIPIKLTLRDCPPGITRIHLPAHTISKPKFQAKPPHQKSEDTLELSTMLVCASAMQKDGLEEIAFKRALTDEIPVKHEDSNTVASSDDNDPDKPLNGGPVAICPGCIVRERKRAARKKTKKVEEEEEWAKDEAKRVIVFNCPEVRDWCVPGTKETPVRDHEGSLDNIFVQAPMRIACYCRHQSEKTGFQVIFTLKTSTGRVLAQAMSNSIMITDDHKQPIQHAPSTSAMSFPTAAPIPAGNLFTGNFIVPPGATHMATFQETMPFRTSYSTNDLASMGRFQSQFMHQMQQPPFNRAYTNGRSQTSTASATPRNLSRPASPTDPTGQPSKKRRSGGIGKVPSGLTMTRLDTKGSPSNANVANPPPTAGFNFQSPTSSQFNSTLESVAQPGMSSNNFQSGPSTPHGGSMSGYGSPAPVENADPFGYYSAPTSQHPSRAPSPNSLRTLPNQGYQQVPQAAADRLSKITSTLPPGLNLSRPPIIQRLIPPSGSCSGGDEVTVLGSGFFQGLEVMFGDVPASNTVFWGDTTLVCRTPPAPSTGPVAVMFQHQHETADSEIQQAVQQFQNILMPARLVTYNYTGPERFESFSLQQQHQSQQQQTKHGGIDPNQLKNDALQARFLQQQQHNLQAQGLDNYIRSGPQPPRAMQQSVDRSGHR